MAALASHAIRALAVRSFRNLAAVELAPIPALNVFAGPNGAGKTSLLEALYFFATSRSFRTPRPSEVVRHGDEVAVVRGTIAAAGHEREQRASVRPGGGTSVRVGERRPASLAEYAMRTPLVAFHPAELALTTGPASARRTLLDRVALYLDPASAEDKARYQLALRQRQRLLTQGVQEGAELDSFEALAAQHGAALTRVRTRAVEAIAASFADVFGRVGAPALRAEAHYEAKGEPEAPALLERLQRDRPRDRFRPTAAAGPHRDDLAISLEGRPARGLASQGQHRALTLALKAAESRAVGEAAGLRPLWLLDDVSSELDAERLRALFRFLREESEQIFVTTTRADLLEEATRGLGFDLANHAVEAGRIAPEGTSARGR